jgi:hypothetical protein
MQVIYNDKVNKVKRMVGNIILPRLNKQKIRFLKYLIFSFSTLVTVNEIAQPLLYCLTFGIFKCIKTE